MIAKVLALFLCSTVSAFVPTPSSNYCSHGLDSWNQEKNEIDDQYDVERFKNRAELTKSILKEKLEEVKLLRGKVNILQDVVNRLQTKSKQQLKSELEKQDLKNRQSLTSLQEELNTTKLRFKKQSQEQLMLVREMEEDLARQRVESKELRKEASFAKEQLGNQIKALKKEVLDMDQALESAQGELQKVERKLASREEEILAMEKSETTRKKLAEQVKQLELEREEAVKKAATAEAMRLESIQIAESSVQAAAKREEAMKSELDQLKVLVANLKNDNEELVNKLQASGAQNDPTLQNKIEDLERKLVQAKMVADSNLKMERERFEIKLNEDRQKFDEEINQLRDQMNKGQGSSSTTGRDPRPRGSMWRRAWNSLRNGY